jgi:hypothetical protein
MKFTATNIKLLKLIGFKYEGKEGWYINGYEFHLSKYNSIKHLIHNLMLWEHNRGKMEALSGVGQFFTKGYKESEEMDKNIRFK